MKNKRRITVTLPETLIELLGSELKQWETSTSKQILWVLQGWVRDVKSEKNNHSLKGGECLLE